MSLGSFAQASQNLAKQNKVVNLFDRSLESGSHEEYCGWTIDVAKRKVGLTVRRDVFSVTLRNNLSEEYHSGYSSIPDALAAARRRVDVLSRTAHKKATRRVPSNTQRSDTNS